MKSEPAAGFERPTVVIPTYNEIENVRIVTERVLALADDFHVIIVDDGSPDGTGAVADNFFAELYAEDGTVITPHFRVNQTPQNSQPQLALPAVAPCGGGTDCFVVVWQHDDPNMSLTGIYGQRVTADGQSPE